MNADRNEADRILGEDWMMPGYRWFLEAWEKHPWRELLDERKGEVDEDGGVPSASSTRTAGSSTGLRSTDLRDGRESICIGRWPEKAETDELAYARAMVDEHDDAPR